MEYVITDPGKTTFKVGEVVSREAFDKENERVKRLGERPATGRPSSGRDRISIPVFDPLGILERATKDAPVTLYDPVSAAVRDVLKGEHSNPEGRTEREQAEFRLSIALDLEKLGFLYEGFLYSVEEIRDAVMDRNFDKLIEEIQRGKSDVERAASGAPSNIREEYLPKVLESFDIFEGNVRVDLEKYPDRAWEEIEEHLWEFRDRNAHYLIMAMKDLGKG